MSKQTNVFTKNVKALKKSLCFGVVLATTVASCLTTAFATTNTSTQTSLKNLDVAGQCAVFANNCEIKCDMEGNVAAKTASFNGVHIGLTSNVTGYKTSYVERFKDIYWCSEFLKTTNCTDTFIIGNDYTITKKNEWLISENGRTILKSPLANVQNIVNAKDLSYNIYFESYFNDLKNVSSKLATITTNSVDVKLGTNYNRNGSLTCKNNVNVVNLTMAQYNAMYDFDIKMASDASIVINIADYNGQNLDNKITINGRRDTYKGLAGRVLWNFGSYCKSVSFGETNQGCILAPYAKVIINSTHNGNVIGNTVTNPGGEIHKNDYVGKFPLVCCK